MILTDNLFEYKYIDLYATPEQIKLAQEFAPKYAKSVHQHYAKTRKQSDINLIAAQAFPSKIFEYMVYNYLSNYGICTEPDIQIYEDKQKSFDCDLVFKQFLFEEYKTYKIHVKSQDALTIKSKDYISWGFQKWDPLYLNPRPEDMIITGIIMEDREFGRLLVKRAAQDVMPLAGEPRKAAFIGNKKFLYLQDIQKHTDPLGPRKQ